LHGPLKKENVAFFYLLIKIRLGQVNSIGRYFKAQKPMKSTLELLKTGPKSPQRRRHNNNQQTAGGSTHHGSI
jgi:hypothetical protein